MKIASIIICLLVLQGCNDSRTLDQFMLDRWETKYIKITFPTNNNTDSTFVYEDDFSNSGGVKAQSEYYPDGTFFSWYLVNSKVTNKTKGKWVVKNDSLYLDYMSNNRNIKPIYHIKPTNYGFDGMSIYDWDNDGVKDDTLVMKSESF